MNRLDPETAKGCGKAVLAIVASVLIMYALPDTLHIQKIAMGIGLYLAIMAI